jgi:hypothetical protein
LPRLQISLGLQVLQHPHEGLTRQAELLGKDAACRQAGAGTQVPLQDGRAQLVLYLPEFRQGDAGVQTKEGQDRTFELLGQG